jgi:DNA-directed RNA polymerase specialized sigma24 family protein
MTDDLFTLAARYPATPGSKSDLDTAKAAAADMASEAGTLRRECLAALAGADLTADEIADRVGRSILSIRPRISELRARNKVKPTDTRRRNRSGKNAVVWTLV